jgi:hypothetical protein
MHEDFIKAYGGQLKKQNEADRWSPSEAQEHTTPSQTEADRCHEVQVIIWWQYGGNIDDVPIIPNDHFLATSCT